MFSPNKLTLLIDTATIIAFLGFVVAACACVMLKNGIEKLITGEPESRFGRIKGLALTMIAMSFLLVGIATILEPEMVTSLPSVQVQNLLKQTFSLQM